jgi:hypothetical protein
MFLNKIFKVSCAIAFTLTAFLGSAQTPMLSFDGSNDYVDLGGDAGDDLRTIEMWFSPASDINSSITVPQTLICRETSLPNNTNEFSMSFWPGDGRLRFDMSPSSGSNVSIYSNSATWNMDQWYHVAAVIDGTNGMELYIDGVKQTDVNTGFTSTTGSMTQMTALGVWGQFFQRYYAGRIEDVRLSTDALYSADFTPPCPDAILAASTTGLWNMNEGTGSTIADSSPSGNTGTINGATWTEDLICENQESCVCDAKLGLTPLTSMTTNGNQSFSLSIDTQGELVTSVCIVLPYYVSLVDESCLKCDVSNLTSNGTVLGGAPLAGTPITLVDPFGLGHSRKVCYNFPAPIAINQSIQLDLKFPAVLDLSCCQNAVNFCFDVTIKKDDCTSCEYTVCNNMHPKQKASTSIAPEVRNDQSIPARELEISVFPNPASKNVNVEINENEFSGGTVLLNTTDGRLIQSQNVDSKKFNMELNDVTPGTYIITVNSGTQKASKLLVIE